MLDGLPCVELHIGGELPIDDLHIDLSQAAAVGLGGDDLLPLQGQR